MIKIVIVSPNRNAYSETFIQAHKNIPNAEIHFLFGGLIPTESEHGGSLAKFPSLFEKIRNKFFRIKPQNVYEVGFKNYLRKNRIDAVLAEFGMSGAMVTPVCKVLNIPLFVHFHGLDASIKSILDSYRDRYVEMFSFSTNIFAVSKEMNKRLIDMGCPPQKIILNTYGPNDIFLNLTPTFSESKSFVAIGRFVDKKAPYYTILAIKKVAESYPDVKLYFAGTGELHQTCINLARYYNLETQVQFLGIIDHQHYAKILKNVTGFIQHSITSENGDMEGTPLGILEASAAGIPIIATNHAGIPDVVLDGETGYLVEEHAVDEMATKLIELIENPSIAFKMGIAGKKRIKDCFSMKKHLQVISEAIIKGVIQ